MDSASRVLELLNHGPQSAKTLCTSLGVSQPTVSRLIARLSDKVVRFGRGRSTHYCAVAEGSYSTPLYCVDEKGQVQELAQFIPLKLGHYLLTQIQADTPFWLLGANGNGYYEDLPFFLDDLRPQGFLGRQIATHLSKIKPYPNDPRHWNAQQIVRYLTEEGYDLPGNLLLGEQALQLFLISNPAVVKVRDDDYLLLSKQALSDGVPGSSAGGEQQKFTAYTADKGHVIVKFSSAADSPEAQRWRDLIFSEHIALTLLRENGMTTAEHQVYEFEGRVFLESQRFDRSGLSGRLPMISLSVIDAEFVGHGLNWVNIGERLFKQGLLSHNDFQNIVFFHTFGQWINNTDMHLGNISLKPGKRDFSLYPLYDMLPMGFVIRQGEEVQRPFHAPVQTIVNKDVWQTCGTLSTIYWQRVIEDHRISDNFKNIAKKQCAQIKETLK